MMMMMVMMVMMMMMMMMTTTTTTTTTPMLLLLLLLPLLDDVCGCGGAVVTVTLPLLPSRIDLHEGSPRKDFMVGTFW